MSRILLAIALFFNSIAGIAAQKMPEDLLGKWRVRRILPVDTVSCWSDKEARDLLGTEIEYSNDVFRWRGELIEHPSFDIRVITANEFQKEYSGSSSSVDYRSLGIRASQATKVQINHPPARITGGSIEIPGDVVLIKDRNTIVFSVCNVYFEAKRESVQKKASTH
jgi:hypothetical protein